jgi:hypothetical protein
VAIADIAVSSLFVGDPAVCVTIPLTQKARGIVALSKLDADANMPSFSVYAAQQVQPRQLVGYFARPCPMRPRHGFVESRLVNTVEEGATLIHETLSADPEAEIVTMPHVPAKFSGIWTPGFLVIGKGTDGATSGTSALTIPALGDLTNNNCALKNAAGIEGTPYLELLWPRIDALPQRVQLRDGPSLPQSLDYIPETVEVSYVVPAEGDLLAWERRMREALPGTVVYHPGGSLASHYAIHAVLNHIPVLISRQPVVGQELQADNANGGEAATDIEALRAGFRAALRIKITKTQATLIMLAGCHHIAVWKGKQDCLLGLSLGFGYRLAVTAALGEMRHSCREGRKIERDVLYSGCWDRTFHGHVRSRFRKALHGFLRSESWRSGFGGRRWFEFTRWAAVIHNRLLKSDGNGALEALNQLVHGFHNGGWGFNKFVSDHLLDRTAQNPVTSLAECGPSLYQAAEIVRERQAQLANEFVERTSLIDFPQDFDVIEIYYDDRDERRYHQRREWCGQPRVAVPTESAEPESRIRDKRRPIRRLQW